MDSKKAAKAQIYGLLEPDTGELRYIGKANDVEKSIVTHVRDSRRRNTPVCCWVRSLTTVGKIPDVIILSETDDWISEERRLIAAARRNGYRLLNLADGGDQPKASYAQLAANGRKAAKRRTDSPEKRALCLAKLMLSSYVKRGLLPGACPIKFEKIKEKMRYAARKRPDLFACWSNI